MIPQSIVMPYHRNKEMLLYTTQLLCASIPDEVEIIVVGNNSDEKELDVDLPERIRYYKFQESLLYSQTVNKGVALAHGEIVTLCDQDIFGFDDWYQPLLKKLLSSDSIGAVSGKLLNPINDRIIDFGIEYSPRRIVHPLRGLKSNHPLALSDRKVTSSTSAILMMRKATYEKVGGMDLDMPYCCSDCDIGIKIGKIGLENWVVSEAVAYHRGSSSTKNGKSSSFSYLKYDSDKMFWVKNYAQLQPTVVSYIQASFHFLQDSSHRDFPKLYQFINLSTTDEYKWYAQKLTEISGISIAGIYSYPQRCDHYSSFELQIYDAVPYTFMNDSVPLIFFVDYFPSLIGCNMIWSHMRNPRNDLVMDVHGNILSMQDVLDGRA